MIDQEFRIETSMPTSELRKVVKALEPWRVTFSNGVDTSDFKTVEPFNRTPLNKLQLIEKHAGHEQLVGKRALDIGFNAGYNSITLVKEFYCNVTGIENNYLNLEKAKRLAKISDLDIEFQIADANTYSKPGEFDLILHLGTLYHLPDIVMALRLTAENLKPGGHLYLETVAYNADDEYACKFVHGFNNDMSNYWALSDRTIFHIFEMYGVVAGEKILEVNIPLYKGTGLSRALYYGRKKG